MAEKSSELEQKSGILTDSDREIISTAADSTDPGFLEKYTDDYSETALDEPSTEEDTDQSATDETDQIRSQIEETRSQMGETIDAIQEKLSFQNISEQVKEQVSEQLTNALETAKDTVYSATIGKAGKFMQNVGREFSKTDIGKIARKNPFPLILIGLGVGILAYESFNGKNRRPARYGNGGGRKSFDGESASSSKSLLKSAPGKIGDAASSAYESVSGAASTALHSVGDAASSAYGSVTNAASSAYSGVQNFAGTAKEKVGDYSTQAREQYEYYIEENPLAVGAVALAFGAAVGLAIPSTQYEGQLMGEYRQQVFDKAQTAAGELVDKVKEVASEAKKTIGEEVKTAVSETQKTISDEAGKKGLTL